MAPEQYNGSFDYLKTLNVQQLRGILHSELDEDEVNIELIKKINAVLASKTEEPELDVDSAYDRLRAAEGSEPLYSEVKDEMTAEKAVRPRPKFRALFKVGLVAAVVIVLFIGTGIVGYAMGFDFWGAMREWTEDRFGFLAGENIDGSLYGENDIKDPYSKLRDELQANGVTVDVVPEYMPPGYSISSVISSKGIRGSSVICTLTNNGIEIVLNYLILEEEPARIFAKDEVTPEVYTVCGIEHNIFSNEESYIAVWVNQNIQCEIYKAENKEELLKMIDSIYKER